MRQLKITKSITNRESASLDKYLQEIGKEELITVEEEVELAQRIRKGDQEALDKLTKANLRFVVSVAKQYQNQGLMIVVAFFRELLGSGTLFGFRVIPASFYEMGYVNNGMMMMPAMALIIVACIIWVHRSINKDLQEK